MTTTPAWINRAAGAIFRGVCDLDLADAESIAALIAKHVPKPKAFEWKHWVGDTWYAKTPFGEYRACNISWSFNGYSDNADSLEAAKAAAFADFCDKLKACYGEAHE